MELAQFGWNEMWSQELAGLGEPMWIPGRVVSEHRGACILITASGEMPASVAGRLQHHATSAAELPKTGDWVAASPLPKEQKAVIQRVLHRRSMIGRKVPGGTTSQQVLAANIDLAFIVQALDDTFNVRRLERFLLLTHEGGVKPVVVLNKADVCPDVEALVEAAQAAVGSCPIIVTSAKTRRGLTRLAALIRPTETVLFLGMSGAGKSSLVNRLYGDELQATIEVREADSKGRHTTTSRELVPLPNGGFVIDSPGLREVQLWVAEETVGTAFPEIACLAAGCRFRDCRHQNEPACAVRAAAGSAALSSERYASFLKLQNEQSSLGEDRRQHAAVRRQRQRKVAHGKLNAVPRHQLEAED